MKNVRDCQTPTRADFVTVYANSRGRRFVEANELFSAEEVQQVLRDAETLFAPHRAGEVPNHAPSNEE